MATIAVDDVKTIAMQEIEAMISQYAHLPAEQLRVLRDYAAHQTKELARATPANLPNATMVVAAGIALKAANQAVELGDALDEAGQVALTNSIRVGMMIVARAIAGAV